MSSTTGLYGDTSAPKVPSNDTTSLYGASQNTAVPASSGDLVVRGNLAVNGGTITTTATTANLFNSNHGTLNIGGQADQVNIGSVSSNTIVQHNLTVLGAFTGGGGSTFGNLLLGPAADPNLITTTNGILKLNSASGVVEVDAATVYVGNLNLTALGIGVATGNLYLGAQTGVHMDMGNSHYYFNADGSTHFPNYTFPAADGSALQFLTTNGSGLLAWTTAAGGVTSLTGGQHITASAATGAVTLGSDATSANTAGTIVARDSSGNFSAGVITAALTGNVTGTVSSFSNHTTSDLAEGTNQYFTAARARAVLSSGAGIAYNSTTGVIALDGTGEVISIVAGPGISASSPGGVVTVTNTGVLSAAASAHVTVSSATGAVTIGTDATSANTASTIVARDINGDFTTRNITAIGGITTPDVQAPSGGSLAIYSNDANSKFLVQNGVAQVTNNSKNWTFNSDGSMNFAGDLKLQPAAEINWAENSARANRLSFKASNGTSTGIRVQPPVATGGTAIASVSTTNDANNASFVNISANQAAANPLRIATGKYINGVLGASGTSIAFVDNVTTYATVNPAGPTVGTDLTTKTYVDNLPHLTYAIDATATTGGANLNLRASDATVDTIKFASGTGITVSDLDANTITVTNSGVISTTAGTGIAVSGSTGAVTINNTGVTGAVAGSGIGVSAGTGSVTFSNTGVISTTAGTGIAVSGSTGAVTVTNTGVTGITGTANQVIASAATGAITLSLPQSIAATSTPTFAKVLTNEIDTTATFAFNNGANYATVNPAGPTTGTDLVTKTYSDANRGKYNTVLEGSGTLTLTASQAGSLIAGTYSRVDLPLISTMSAGQKFNFLNNNTAQMVIYVAGVATYFLTKSQSLELTADAASIWLASGGTYLIGTQPTVALQALDVFGPSQFAGTLWANVGNFSVPAADAIFLDPDLIRIGENTRATAGTPTINFTAAGGTTSDYDSQIIVSGGANTNNQGTLTAKAGVFNVNVNSRNWSFNNDGSTQFPGYKFPLAAGTNNQVLRTDAAGNLSWYSPSDANTTYSLSLPVTGLNSAQIRLLGSDSTTSVINMSSGIGVTGIGIDTSSGQIVISNTGVKSLTAGTGISVSSTTGAVTVNSTITQYTDALARASINAGSGISYSSATGTISNNQLQYTDAMARAAISASGDISYNSTTGVISYTAPAASVTSVNSKTGAVVLTTSDIAQGTNLYYTDALARASISAGTGISYNSTTGVITSTAAPSTVTSVAGSGHITAVTAGGVVTVGSDAIDTNTAGTIVARDASGNFAAGIITANLTDKSYILGALEATTNAAYTFGAPSLNTISGNNGLDSASSYVNTALGNQSQAQFVHYFGDTFAGTQTNGSFSFKSANGNSASGTVPFTGLSAAAPSALTASQNMGSFNFNGYATTGFTDIIGAAGQGGGFAPVHAMQIQAASNEAFVDGTLTISGATITAASRVSAAIAAVSVTGTRGQISFTATTPSVGNCVVVTGTNSGTATGITAGNYFIIAIVGTTGATLSLTPGGAPITTTAGTTTGLTFTRQFITVTYALQAYIPFGANAKITVSGINNVPAGTYMAMGTSTTTSINIGAPSSAAPTLSGTQSISCPTVTNAGTFLRVRAMPNGLPLNTANRVEILNHSVATATYKSDQFNFQGGTNAFNYITANAGAVTVYSSLVVKDLGNTTTYLTVDAVKAQFTKPVGFAAYTAVALRAITGAVGYTAAVSDNQGKLAYWNTTLAAWAYVATDTPV